MASDGACDLPACEEEEVAKDRERVTSDLLVRDIWVSNGDDRMDVSPLENVESMKASKVRVE